MARDRLLLLQSTFSDPVYPGRSFYCWHCALLEGLLAAFPERGQELDVQRVAWPRPRAPVIALAGEANQSLPLLVLAKGGTSAYRTGAHRGRVIVAGKANILAALSERHGFPEPHP